VRPRGQFGRVRSSDAIGPAVLEQDDRIPSRVDARFEELQCAATVKREPSAQRRSRSRDECPIVARVGKEEDQPVHATVALLEGQPPLERLHVAWASFRFDGSSHAASTLRDPEPANDRIPCPKIGGAGEWHFRSAHEGRVKSTTKSVEQGDLRRVPDGIARRVEPDRQIQTEDRGDHRQLRDRDVERQSTLDPAVLGRRDAHSMGDDCLRQGRVAARATKLASGRRDELSTARETDVHTSLPDRNAGQDRERGFAVRYVVVGGGSPGSGPVATGSPERDQSLYEPT